MTAPISVQLYSVRDIAKDDYAGTMERIAEMGYIGVEPAGFPGSNVDGEYVYKHMLGLLNPDVFFQVDCYWVKTAGPEPAEIVAELGGRAPLLHIKDGPCDKELAMTAVGDGIIDWPPVIAAGGEHTEWLVVELDRCDTDMMDAIGKSYQYLVGNGLARGKR